MQRTDQGKLEGVHGASVEIRSRNEDRPPLLGTSDEHGHLEARVPRAALSLTAWRGDLASDAVLVQPENISRGEVVLILGPTLRISGWIHDRNTGAPIEGVRVWIPEHLETRPVRSGETGWYEFDLLAAVGKGRVLCFEANGYATEWVLVFAYSDLGWRLHLPESSLSQPTRALPLAPSVRAASPAVPGPAGRSLGGRELRGRGSPIPLDVDLLPTASLTLRVVSHLRAPLEGVVATASGYVSYAPGLFAPDEAHDTSSVSGEVELTGLRPDVPHRLVLRREGFAPLSLVLSALVGPRTDLGDVPLAPGFTVSGRILGNPRVDGTRVELAGGPPEGELSPATPGGMVTSGPLVSLQTDVDDGGTFRFQHVPAGVYDVKLQVGGDVESSSQIEITESDPPWIEIRLPHR